MHYKKAYQKQYLAAVSLLTVFLVDILTPARFGVDILYLCAILLVYKLPARTIIGFTIVACLLILLDEDIFIMHQPLASVGADWFNRLISVFAILVAASIAISYRKAQDVALQKERKYYADMKAMLFMTSHQVRKPVANILGLTQALDALEGDPQEKMQYLHQSAAELDGAIRQLNRFLEEAESSNKPIN